MNTAQTTKNLAQKIAKQMAQEPLEILKTARNQVSGEAPGQPGGGPAEQQNTQQVQEEGNLQDKLKSQRRMEALNRELDDMRKQKIFAELQNRISQGEEVPLEEYPILSMEQKQVLKAQMEAVRTQNSRFQIPDSNLVEPAPKKGRQLFNFGKKTAMKREQTHVEKIVPPSG